MSFEYPLYLCLLLLLFPLAGWFWWHIRHRQSTLKVATLKGVKGVSKTWRVRWVYLPYLVRLLCFVTLVLALARPLLPLQEKETEWEGIDIMMVLDISESMEVNDLHPSRIEAAKRVASEFVNHREQDHIGLTLFAGEAFLQCPLTRDHAVLLEQLRNVSCGKSKYGLLEAGTAVGMGLCTAVLHLEKSVATSKVVVLLTDGANSKGEINPLEAAELASEKGIRVYTILVGNENEDTTTASRLVVRSDKQDESTSVEATALLQKIATTANGHFYHASSGKELQRIYQDIDQLEKSRQKVKSHRDSYPIFSYFLWAAFSFLLLEILLRLTWWHRLL